jgi:hypothetical protein
VIDAIDVWMLVASEINSILNLLRLPQIQETCTQPYDKKRRSQKKKIHIFVLFRTTKNTGVKDKCP